MTARRASTFTFELRKLTRATVTRVATLATVTLVLATTAGGYAAVRHAPTTDMGQKAAGLMMTTGWSGFTALAATSVGITTLLAVGIVVAWSTGREFTDGTVVGLFALPASTAAIARAKIAAALAWMVLLALTAAACVTAAGLILGLPLDGAVGCFAKVGVVSLLLGGSALPVMWVATIGRGYLAGISAALALVVASNLAAGFGLGTYVPWVLPVLWAAPDSPVGDGLLLLPIAVAVAGAALTTRAWARLQLGNR